MTSPKSVPYTADYGKKNTGLEKRRLKNIQERTVEDGYRL